MSKKSAGTEYSYDETDIELLAALKANARQSARELAKALGLHPATVLQRMAKMEAHGIIRGYRADVDLTKLGYEFIGIMEVTVAKGALIEVQDEISRIPNVISVYDITGEYDSLVTIACKTRQQFSALVKKILSIRNVMHTNTHVVLNIVKHTETFTPD
jgi:DNA-binding Lrp family transcriptional regulator